MDAGDWIRLKRIRGLLYYNPEKGVTNPSTAPSLRLEPHTARRVYTEFGTSRIRAPASGFTDYVAVRSADYVMESGGPGNKTLIARRLCSCSLISNPKKRGICPTCVSGTI